MSNLSKNRYNIVNVKDIIKSIQLELEEDESIVFIGQSLVNRGINLNKWHHFKTTYQDNTDVIQGINKIESILEHRIVTKALNNKINTTMAIFLLKNKYGYKDSKQVDNNVVIKPILAGLSNTPDTKVIDATPVKSK